MNAWLIVLMIVVPLLLLAADIYFVIYYQHPEEKFSSWAAKAVVLGSLLLAEICVMMLPLDVANRGPPWGGLPMGVLWMIVYVAIGVMAVIVLPFSMFWYEEEDAEKNRFSKRLRHAAVSELVVLLVYLVVYVVAYILLGVSEILVMKMNANMVSEGVKVDSPCGSSGFDFQGCAYKARELKLQIRISPILFMITEIDFFGYILLVVLGGIGMAALPFDMVLAWRFRPRRLDKTDYESEKKGIGRRADTLVEVGTLIKQRRREGMRGRKERERYNSWKQAVNLLEADWTKLQAAYAFNGWTVIKAWLQLAGGIFSTILTFAWILHIILYMIVGGSKVPFLNGLLKSLTQAWGLLGTIAYAIFAFYLLLCLVKGVVKFGMRFVFFLPIYPMEMNNTFMNAFLFNSILVLVGGLTVTHFCSTAFADFAQTTSVNTIFDICIGSLRYVKYWFKYFIFGLVLVPLLAAIYLGIRPRDKPRKGMDLLA